MVKSGKNGNRVLDTTLSTRLYLLLRNIRGDKARGRYRWWCRFHYYWMWQKHWCRRYRLSCCCLYNWQTKRI